MVLTELGESAELRRTLLNHDKLWRTCFPAICLIADRTKRRPNRTHEVSLYERPSQALRRMAFTSSTPVQDHLIHLLPQGFHVGIGKAGVQRAHAVGVRTRSADGVVELGLADLAGRALGSVAAVCSREPRPDAENPYRATRSSCASEATPAKNPAQLTANRSVPAVSKFCGNQRVNPASTTTRILDADDTAITG